MAPDSEKNGWTTKGSVVSVTMSKSTLFKKCINLDKVHVVDLLLCAVDKDQASYVRV